MKKFRAYREAFLVDPRTSSQAMDPAGWTIPVEGEDAKAATIRLLSVPEFAYPKVAGRFWVHLAEDEDWNRHANGSPLSCRALEVVFEPKPVSSEVGR